MCEALAEKEEVNKLCRPSTGSGHRLIAGFSWPWTSKKKKEAIDIEIEELQFQWNVADEDWINSSTSTREASTGSAP